MFNKITSIFMSIIAAIYGLFGLCYYPTGDMIDMSKFTLTFEEEFNGDLDKNIWSGHYTYGETSSIRRGAYWNNSMAYTEDGKLVIPLKYLSEGKGGTGAGWYSAGIDTDGDNGGGFMQKYGYFECRCILPKISNAWSAFWLMNEDVANEDGSGQDGTEIDIFESDCFGEKQSNAIRSNLHYDGYGSYHQNFGGKKFLIKGDPYSQFNTYGVEWNEKEYIFYINGRESFRTDFGGVSQNEEYLILSFELWGENAVPSVEMDNSEEYEFIVDYVKVYQYKES